MQADIDEFRIARAQRFRVEADRGEFLRADAVHQHIGGVDQLEQRFAPRRLLQVEHDALLAAVDAEKDRAHSVFVARACAARRVAVGRFDLDHLGAVFGQDLARVRPEHDSAQVEDADAVEWKHVGLSPG